MGGDTVGSGDDEFDDVDLPLEHTINVSVIHQNNDGSTGTGVNIQNDSFTVFTGQFLDQSTALCIMSPQAGFTFNESNITVVDGVADTSDGIYEDGVDGALTAKIQTITCTDAVVGGVTVVKVAFTFENVAITSSENISIIIKGNAVDLSSNEVFHRISTTIHGLTSPEDNTQQVFGDGSSGTLATTTAPDSNYTVNLADQTNITNVFINNVSQVLGTSSNGVERTVAIYKVKTSSGHRFVTDGDLFGFGGYLEDAGTGLTASTDPATKILAWLNAHGGLIVNLSAQTNNPTGYDVSFSVVVTNAGASNVQEEITVTIKYTGDGNPEGASFDLFKPKQVKLRAADYNNPAYD